MTELPKTVGIDQLARHVRDAQAEGLTVVLCHGCFDIVHPGHIRHLQHAARQGDRLVVTITGDDAMGKGVGRPLIPQELRAENLAALDCIDWVAINPRATAADLLDEIRPDVYVKGREYEQNRDPRFRREREIVERNGGRVVFTSGDVVFSSTALIDALHEHADPFHSTIRQLIEKHDMTPPRMGALIDQFQGQRVLVIGETIIDTYVMCDRPDVAGESPIMTLRPIEYRSFDGGAAIIAKHLAAMGARPTLLTALPRSPWAETLRQRLMIDGVTPHSITTQRPLIEKQRFLAGTSKVMKLDLGKPMVFDAAQHERLIDMAVGLTAACDAVIVADYGLGLLTPAVLEELCCRIRPTAGLLVGDVSGRRSSLLAMRQMDLICPTELEMRSTLHEFDEGLSSVVWNVMQRTRTGAALVTLGDEGLIAFDRRADTSEAATDWSSHLAAEHIPSFVPHAIDQLGCGDALMAAATLARLAGASLATSAVLGNVAAAAEARRIGNVVIGAADLRRGLQRVLSSQLTWHSEPEAALDRHPGDQLRISHA